MEIPRVVRKVGETMIRYPAETMGLGSAFFGGLLAEGIAHLSPYYYSELYSIVTPGQPTVITTAIGATVVLTYRGLGWLYKTYKNWKIELNQNSIPNLR